MKMWIVYRQTDAQTNQETKGNRQTEKLFWAFKNIYPSIIAFIILMQDSHSESVKERINSADHKIFQFM